MYSNVIRKPVCWYQYCRLSIKSVNGNLTVKGIITLRTSSRAECKDTARLTRKSSSANFSIILGIPEVETVIRLGAIPNPSGKVIFLMAEITSL